MHSLRAAVFAFALVLAGGAAARDLPSLFGGPFTLTDQDGHPRTDADFRGKFLLIFFGYTTCPDICPTDLTDIARALDRLPPKLAARVQPVFVTIDPARDTPALLKDYVANFSPRLIGLTGTEEQVRAAAKAYRVHRSKVVPEGAASADGYLMSHSTLTYLMGPDGRFVTLFPHDTPPEKMAATLSRYLAGE